MFWESPRCPPCPPPPASSSWFHSDPCPSSPFRFCLSLPSTCTRSIWAAAAASRRLGLPTLPVAVPGAAGAERAPQGGKSPHPAGLLQLRWERGHRCRRLRWFFLPGGLSVPFLLPVFPSHPSPKSLLFS